MKKLVVAVVAAGVLLLAGCSDSDTSNTSDAADQAGNAASNAAEGLGGVGSDARQAGFLGALGAAGLKGGSSDSELVDRARETCDDLRDASNARDISTRYADKYDGDENKSRNFVRYAVSAYCPAEIPKLIY